MVFHACQQGQRAKGPRGRPTGRQFVTGAGYNGWAEANGIVVLYPQVHASTAAKPGDTYQLNPEGCWDFWGYTDPQGALTGARHCKLPIAHERPSAAQSRAWSLQGDVCAHRKAAESCRTRQMIAAQRGRPSMQAITGQCRHERRRKSHASLPEIN